MSLAAVSVCLALLVALGGAERAWSRRVRRRVPIRVHVNGTRGKSTVTRLIAAALREAGIPTLAKVTGTEPRLLMPDGSESPIRRRGPANVREQLWTLRLASRLGVRAVVLECMAVRPELQWISEHGMVRATVGVLTNVRQDHLEAMGRTLDEIARSMANTIPRNAVVVVPDNPFADVFQDRARALGSEVVVVPRRPGCSSPVGEEGGTAWLEECEALALAVTRLLGVDDGTALAGMRAAPRDPGAARLTRVPAGAGEVQVLDLTAANDPESCDALVAGSPVGRLPDARRVFVYNHRADRPERLLAFAAGSRSFRGAGRLVVTGDRPPLTLWNAVRGARARRDATYVPVRRLAADVGPGAAGPAAASGGESAHAAIILSGNTRGFDVRHVMARH